MKILLYQEPTFVVRSPYPVSKVCRDHLYLWLAKPLLDYPDVEIKTVVGELTYIQNQEFHHIDELKPLNFKDEFLQQIFPNACSIQEMFLKIFNSNLSEKEHITFQKIIHSLLPKGWEPDIVIDFQIHNELLKKAFPRALHLLVENGIFSRPPFCRTLLYDPIHHLYGFENKYKEEIKNYAINDETRKKVINFTTQLRKIIHKHNPRKKDLENLKKQFKYLILCTIPSDNFYKETKYDDQYLYLLDILNKIPQNIGLIITFHDDHSSQLNAGIIRTLQQKYKNLIYFPVGNNAYLSQSLDFFEYCDAMINVASTTGMQAMLWDVKIISLDKTASAWFCDKQGLENLEAFLAQPKPDKSNMIYWYLTHFTVCENSMEKPNWYYNYFKNKLENFRKNGLTFDLFEQVEDFDELASYILDYVRHYLRHAFKRRFSIHSGGLKQIYALCKQFYRYR